MGLTRPARERPGQDRVYAWAAGHAAGRPFSPAEVAEALAIARSTAGCRLRDLVAAGRMDRLKRGAYGLPGTALPDAEEVPGTGLITAFLGADGGGTWGEIRAATGISAAMLSYYLAALARRGVVVRLDEARGGFYLLPGQEPGEILGAPSAGRVSDRTRLQQPARPRHYPAGREFTSR